MQSMVFDSIYKLIHIIYIYIYNFLFIYIYIYINKKLVNVLY